MSSGASESSSLPPETERVQQAGHAQPTPLIKYGTIIRLKKSFGFIRPVGSHLDTFFHCDELKDLQPAELRVGQAVQFHAGIDTRTGRPCARRVAGAPEAAVQHEEVAEEDSLGLVMQWPLARGTTSQPQPGILRYIDLQGRPTHLMFTAADTNGSSSQSTSIGGWVLFRLCWRAGTQTSEVVGPMGAKHGFRAVQLRIVNPASLDLGITNMAEHFKLLDVLAAVAPR